MLLFFQFGNLNFESCFKFRTRRVTMSQTKTIHFLPVPKMAYKIER